MNSQKKRTEKQIEASRLNGAKSKGPKTDEGKAKSSQNSYRHGFSDGHCLLYFNERDELYQEHLASYTARFAPADRVESALVLRMVHADWRSRRADYMEAAMVDLQMDRMLPEMKAEFNTWDQGTRIAIGFQKVADNSRGLDLLVRYRAAADRAYDRALASLRLLQRDRLRAEEEHISSSRTAPDKQTRKLRLEPEPDYSSPASLPASASSTPDGSTPSILELPASHVHDLASECRHEIFSSSELVKSKSEPDQVQPPTFEVLTPSGAEREILPPEGKNLTSEPDEVEPASFEPPSQSIAGPHASSSEGVKVKTEPEPTAASPSANPTPAGKLKISLPAVEPCHSAGFISVVPPDTSSSEGVNSSNEPEPMVASAPANLADATLAVNSEIHLDIVDPGHSADSISLSGPVDPSSAITDQPNTATSIPSVGCEPQDLQTIDSEAYALQQTTAQMRNPGTKSCQHEPKPTPAPLRPAEPCINRPTSSPVASPPLKEMPPSPIGSGLRKQPHEPEESLEPEPIHLKRAA